MFYRNANTKIGGSMDESELSEEEKFVLGVLRTNGPTKKNGWWMSQISEECKKLMTPNDVKRVIGKLLGKGLVQIMAHNDVRPCYKHHVVELIRNSEAPLTISDVATILRVRLGADEEVTRVDIHELLEDWPPFFGKKLKLNREFKLELGS